MEAFDIVFFTFMYLSSPSMPVYGVSCAIWSTWKPLEKPYQNWKLQLPSITLTTMTLVLNLIPVKPNTLIQFYVIIFNGQSI